MIKHKETYNEARSAFDGLRIEEQAIFLVESAVSMLASGIEQLGAMMARQFDDEAAEGTSTADEGTKKRAAKPSKAGTTSKPRRTAASGTTTRKTRKARPDTDSTN